MSISDDNLKAMQEELKWVSIGEAKTFTDRLMERGIIGLLIPVGCVATTGILLNGVYHMIKKNGRKQQRLMRYRILSQGVTIFLTAIGMSQLKLSR